jgi:hypothetical protein
MPGSTKTARIYDFRRPPGQTQPVRLPSRRQLAARRYVTMQWYFGGTLAVLKKIERQYPEVDGSRISSAIVKLKGELRRAYIRGRPAK